MQAIRMHVDAKSSLCFNVIQFLGGENCDFDVTGAQKQIRLAIDILSNFL